MGEFLRAAHQVLLQVRRPLSPMEIVTRALDKGLLQTAGKTPAQTMKSKLSTDILKKQERSLFMRAAAGRFTLREFNANFPEHVAPRYKKALFDEEIVVIDACSLSRYISRVGLTVDGINTRSLLAECFPMQRRAAEENKSVIQLVSFYIVTYKDRYLTYKRTKRLPEARLHDYCSIGFGGHLNPDDIPSLFNFANPEEALTFILRELREELVLDEEPSIAFRGLLYDTSREISRQHLALVYDVALASDNFRIGERGFLMNPKFETLNEILQHSSDFENWSLLIAREDFARRGM
jgi:predicted NUDIX family phosphoesterase